MAEASKASAAWWKHLDRNILNLRKSETYDHSRIRNNECVFNLFAILVLPNILNIFQINLYSLWMLWTRLQGKAKFPGFIWPSIVLVLVPLARFLGRNWPVAWARWCPTPRRQSRRRFRRWQPSGAGSSEAWTWLKLDRDLSFIYLIIVKTRVWRTRQWWRRRGSVLAYGDWGPGFDSRHRLWFGPLWFPPHLPWTLGFSPLYLSVFLSLLLLL